MGMVERQLEIVERDATPLQSCSVVHDSWAWAEDDPSDEESTADEGGLQNDECWSSESESCAAQVGHVLGDAYCTVQCFGRGAFGDVYLVRDVDTCQEYAAKFAEGDSGLVWEAEVLDRLSGLPGFPAMHYCGVKGSSAVLVMDLLGHNLAELHRLCGNHFTLKTVLMVADQVLQRVEGLHSRGIVHRDIKPENFMVGCADEASTIHAIDFGLANEYCEMETLQHIPRRSGLEFTGTVVYASLHAHLGVEQSRRDDLESVGYMLISLLRGELPWEGTCDADCSDDAWVKHCEEQKAQMPLAEICTGCPEEFEQYLRYCRNLKFEEEPDYQYLRSLFEDVLTREGLANDGILDWSN